MNCLFCNRQLPQTMKFWQLFTLSKLSALTENLCKRCEDLFEPICPDSHCPRCCKAGTATICQDCQDWEDRDVIIRHTALYTYNDAMKDYFRTYKFIGDYRLRLVFQAIIKRSLLSFTSYTFVPIPVSAQRFQARGFNQVEGLLELTPYQQLLVKADSIKQSSLARVDRLKTSNPFSVSADSTLPPKLLLIDDVYTTGMTLVHAIHTLKALGVNDIQTFSLAR